MPKKAQQKDKVKIPSHYRELDPTDKVEAGDEFYSKTFAAWYAVKDEQIGRLAKGALFIRPEKKEEMNKVIVDD
jgi:hypothetical protein